MKNIKFLKGVLTIALFALSLVAFAQDKEIPYSEVPAPIQSYITTHFPSNQVLKAEVDNDGLAKEYDISLSDKFELEFNSSGQPKSIEGKSKLPDSVVPPQIKSYVEKNYAGNYITKWDLSKKHQSVELNNKLDLKFTLSGDFVKAE